MKIALSVLLGAIDQEAMLADAIGPFIAKIAQADTFDISISYRDLLGSGGLYSHVVADGKGIINLDQVNQWSVG